MEWWDEDPELLGATLGMLAAWNGNDNGGGGGTEKREDMSSAASSGSWNSDDGADDAGSKPTSNSGGRGRCVNISRERRKRELHYLRKKVSDMKGKLGELQHRRETLLRPHYQDTDKTQLLTAVPVWENMATRQFQARKKSEVRNAKLRMMHSAQVRVAEDLIHLIQQAQQACLTHTPPPLALDVSRRMSYDDQIACVNALSLQWDDAHARSSSLFQSGPLRFFNMCVAEHSGFETVTDAVSSNALPFPMAFVEDAMWSLYQSNLPEDELGSYEQVVHGTDEMLLSSFTSSTSLGGPLRGTMSGQVVYKRLGLSGTQRLIVSHSYTEPQGFNNELDGGLIIDEVWVRLVDAHDLGHTHLASPLTIIQYIHRSRITLSQHHEMPDPSRVEALTSLFMKQIEEELLWAQQMIENTLMEAPAIKQE